MALFCGVSVGSAVTLDWSAVTWTAGSLSNSYDIDPSNPGNDITIAMSGNTGNFNSGSPSIGTGLGGYGEVFPPAGADFLIHQPIHNRNDQL